MLHHSIAANEELYYLLSWDNEHIKVCLNFKMFIQVFKLKKKFVALEHL